MNQIKSFISSIGLDSLIDSMRVITPSNDEMFAKNIKGLSELDEANLCQILKFLDEQELVIQKTDNEMKKMKEIKETRVNTVSIPAIIGTLGFTVVSIASLTALIVSKQLAVSNKVFSMGTLITSTLSTALFASKSRYATAQEKGFEIASLRIARLYVKINKIEDEIKFINGDEDLLEEKCQALSSISKQLKVAKKGFKKIIDHYEALEWKASRSIDGYRFDENGLRSFTTPIYKHLPTYVHYTDHIVLEQRLHQVGTHTEIYGRRDDY